MYIHLYRGCFVAPVVPFRRHVGRPPAVSARHSCSAGPGTAAAARQSGDAAVRSPVSALHPANGGDGPVLPGLQGRLHPTAPGG